MSSLPTQRVGRADKPIHTEGVGRLRMSTIAGWLLWTGNKYCFGYYDCANFCGVYARVVLLQPSVSIYVALHETWMDSRGTVARARKAVSGNAVQIIHDLRNAFMTVVHRLGIKGTEFAQRCNISFSVLDPNRPENSLPIHLSQVYQHSNESHLASQHSQQSHPSSQHSHQSHQSHHHHKKVFKLAFEGT